MRFGALVVVLQICTMGCTIPNTAAHQPDGWVGDLTRSKDSGVFVGDGLPASGTIAIFIKGDRSQPKQPHADGLVGQTPLDYKIAVSRYQILRSANDPAPFLCFDHGKQPFVSDISGDNLVGHCQTNSIKTGLYTHGRTKVDWARYSVEGVYHYLGQKLSGTFTFFRAFSDVVYKGKPYKAGQGTIRFSGITTVEIPVTYGPLPPMPGVTFKTHAGELSMTFRYSHPLQIEQTDAGQHWARFHWKIGDSFRWADTAGLGYKHGVWDVSALAVYTEQIKVHGVTGYYVTSSKD
jgi:hypothetical protein